MLAKLQRYLIRMSTRPTPYGMFAGVAVGHLGEQTDLAPGHGPPRTRMRPDMAWLLEFVAAVEDAPDVRRRAAADGQPAVSMLADRACLAERASIERDRDARPVTIRATAAVRHALDRARAPVALGRPGRCRSWLCPARPRRRSTRLLDRALGRRRSCSPSCGRR